MYICMSPYYSSQVISVSLHEIFAYVRHIAGPICSLVDTANLLIILAGWFYIEFKVLATKVGTMRYHLTTSPRWSDSHKYVTLQAIGPICSLGDTVNLSTNYLSQWFYIEFEVPAAVIGILRCGVVRMCGNSCTCKSDCEFDCIG